MMTTIRHRQYRGFGRKLGGALVLSLMLALGAQPLAAQDRITQSELNVALLYNVMKFVRWPANSFASEEAPIGVCTFSSRQYDEPLMALEKRSVGSRSINVRALSQPGDSLDGCHVLFFASESGVSYEEALKRAENLPILTVGDFSEFANKGGMVSLSKGRKRVNITINVNESDRVGLEFNSQLLELATVIRSGAGGSR